MSSGHPEVLMQSLNTSRIVPQFRQNKDVESAILHLCHTLKACVLGFDGTLVNYIINSRGILAHYLSLFGAARCSNISLKVLSNEMDTAEIRFL
jgi:hypothetical protein